MRALTYFRIKLISSLRLMRPYMRLMCCSCILSA
nr:MAG TPA: hypothetical protein [Caudoviricetes sp.]